MVSASLHGQGKQAGRRVNGNFQSSTKKPVCQKADQAARLEGNVEDLLGVEAFSRIGMVGQPATRPLTLPYFGHKIGT